jgi:MFS family permease
VALGFHGVVRAFQQPARQSLLPQIATAETFPNAVTWGTGAFHLAQMLGPLVAGFILHLMQSAWLVYTIYAMLAILFFVMLFWVEHQPGERTNEAISFETVTSGLTFVFRNKLLLTALSIDLFAVLLGGATGLLPVFQRDILEVGEIWYGMLRAAPAMGAVIVSVVIAHRPPFERAGRAMLLAVAGYGLATIVFGISMTLWLTILALFLSGACDIVSVVIRHTMIQTLTPDAMRGRVSAINGMFIGASNYLGDAEAGYIAQWSGDFLQDPLLGTKISVVGGGIGSLVIAGGAALLSPPFRRFGRIEMATPHERLEGARES